MLRFYRGYIKLDGKKAMEKFKNVPDSELRSINEVMNLDSYAGILNEDTILIDVDNEEDSDTLFNIIQEEGLKCRIYQTTRGKHFMFKVGDYNDGNKTEVKTAIGLSVDIKVGMNNAYQALKVDGVQRNIIWEAEGDVDVVPNWLLPVNTNLDLQGMSDGDGRNDALFGYILTLQKQSFSTEEIKKTIHLINEYIFDEPMDEDEISTIIREEAFGKPVFFEKNRFMHDVFSKFLIKEHHIRRINNTLHIYKDGVYVQGRRVIEHTMLQHITSLNKHQRSEVLSYIDSYIYHNEVTTSPEMIAFENGLLNVYTGKMEEFTPDYIITNKIPWDYNPDAYDELADNTLNKMACYNEDVRKLMEEMVGYTLYRRNELGKAFILTGEKSNGKSTFLAMVQTMLGVKNISSLDIGELGERFKTAELFGKLANIGDDISDEYIPDPSVFKKLVTGETTNVERKGEDPFDFSNYSKLMFSANNVPRLGRGRDAGAIMRRLIIVPFDATFSVSDPDFRPYIKYDLTSEIAIQYLINIGLEGLNRILKYNNFTIPNKSDEMLKEYEIQTNPILGFFEELDVDEDVINEPTKDLYMKYQVYAHENGINAVASNVFGREVSKHFDVESKGKWIDGKTIRVYVLEEGT